MSHHEFILKPGKWIGEGKISFSASPERLRFYTKWQVNTEENQIIQCHQEVEMEDRSENVHNNLIFKDLKADSFLVQFKSELLGTISGKGIIDAKTIAWEFRDLPEFEGFEVYELQDNGDYMLHAEYVSSEHFRTIIDGRIWKKME